MIGVGSFDLPVLSGEPDPAAEQFDDLPFAVPYAERLAATLRAYQSGGFGVTLLLDPDRDGIHTAVQALLDDTAVTARLVHVISHGRSSRQRDYVEVVGRCRRAGGNDVRGWVSAAEDSGVPTLFLVDLCGAGRGADLQFAHEPDAGEQMAWVIAACRGDEPAWDGAFTNVVTRILAECGRDGLGTDTRTSHVPLVEFARRVADALQGQTLTATKAQFHLTPDLPFLPNPRYVPDPVADRIAAVDPGLQPFLSDAVADPAHFRTRAGLHFTGRQSFLDRLVPWLDGAAGGGLWLVTGTAGAGKSALLGALVCAAHPQLAAITGHVRAALDDPPALLPALLAVHARQRVLTEILSSIGRQLGLPAPVGGWTAAELIAVITARPEPPVLVLDALDECLEAGAVQSLLLMPLATAQRPDGTAAARVLVAARPWEQFAPLRRHAEHLNQVSDLDTADPGQLRRDLRRFLISALGGLPAAEQLATGVAARLADNHAGNRDDPPITRWGQFLVAARYAGYLRTQPAADDAAVARLLAAVPQDLPQVLELELAEHPQRQQLRTALTALAYAKGAGMPVELLRVIAPVLGPTDPDLFTGDDIRVYLRLGTDDNGVSLLRLYHQGLADYLRPALPHLPSDRPADTGLRVFDALIATRRTDSGATSWQYAPAYLRRHAIQHAADAGTVDDLLHDAEFLLHADPITLLPELDHAVTAEGRLGAAIYRSVHHLLPADEQARRRLLRLTALRYGGAHPAAGPPSDNRP
ncbi:hypothetical protein [Dactylosporangium siamense]|uniref:hypothetical protein n=1 Tax=Dactylosporangium siamense TaxID=685454 RepID=UPI0031E89D91